MLKNLDSLTSRSAVIAAAAYWSAAFYRLDPIITTLKLIKIGIRPALVTVLVSYMSNRRMIVKFKGAQSKPKNMMRKSTRNTVGRLEYIIANDFQR